MCVFDEQLKSQHDALEMSHYKALYKSMDTLLSLSTVESCTIVCYQSLGRWVAGVVYVGLELTA